MRELLYINIYIHDALQLRWAVIEVEDARRPMLCGNEIMLVGAAKRGALVRMEDGNGMLILQYYQR